MSEPTITGGWSGLRVYAPQFHGVQPAQFEAASGAPTPAGVFRGRITDGAE